MLDGKSSEPLDTEMTPVDRIVGQSLESILPIVQEHRSVVVALCKAERGIAPEVEPRLDLAFRILERTQLAPFSKKMSYSIRSPWQSALTGTVPVLICSGENAARREAPRNSM